MRKGERGEERSSNSLTQHVPGLELIKYSRMNEGTHGRPEKRVRDIKYSTARKDRVKTQSKS